MYVIEFEFDRDDHFYLAPACFDGQAPIGFPVERDPEHARKFQLAGDVGSFIASVSPEMRDLMSAVPFGTANPPATDS